MSKDSVQVLTSRRRKTISIQVLPDDSLRVIVPYGFDRSFLPEVLRHRKGWIEKIRKRNREARGVLTPLRIEEGHPIRIVDQELTLRRTGQGRVETGIHGSDLLVSLSGCRLSLDECFRRRVIDWCRDLAAQELGERVRVYAERMQIPAPEWKLRSMKSRWGSCSHDGRITFNWKIVFAPGAVMDYLVVHEMAHIFFHNHSREFWGKVSSILPDFRERRTWLRYHGKYLGPANE